MLFAPGDAADLAAKVRLLASDRHRLSAMRRAARLEFESKYTAELNYRQLMELYSRAMANRRTGAVRPTAKEPSAGPVALSGWKASPT
jgi:hypothetical protein